MTTDPTQPGTTVPPGAATCHGGDRAAAAVAPLPDTDFHPDARAAQLAEAEAVFAGVADHPDATLRRACRLVIDLSPDPALRLVATHLLPLLKD